MSGLPYVKDKDLVEVVLDHFIKRQYLFAIVLKESNKVIGSIELMDYSKKHYQGIKVLDGAKEIAFLLNENYWGKGLMAEAVNAVLDFAFNTLNIPQILSGNYIENNQSAKLQNKLGIKIVGEIDYFRIIEKVQTKFIQRAITKEEYLKRPN